MLYRSLAAFREPFGDGFVEAIKSDQEVEIPDQLAERLLAEGHIAPIWTNANVAPDPVALFPESLHARLLRVEAWLWPDETPEAKQAAADRARADELRAMPTRTADEEAELARLPAAEAAPSRPARSAAADKPEAKG